jgi:CDP-diacylglycerol--glycerol-3-phosphate 3-phosphatidyltransferase
MIPQELGKFWTVANMLTLSRLVIAVPLAYLVFVGGSLAWVVALTLAAVATDWFDGRLARWSHTVSGWGKVLDPLVDKVGGGAIVLALVVRGSLPVWYVATLLVRDSLIVWGGIRMTRKVGHIPSSILAGKIAVTSVAITVLAALLEADPPVMQFCLVASSGLLVYSYLRYLGRYFRIVRGGRVVADAAVELSDGATGEVADVAPDVSRSTGGVSGDGSVDESEPAVL